MSSKAKNFGETEIYMLKVAERAALDDGQRVFWREDATLRYEYEQVKHYLETKSRNGDAQAQMDLSEIEAQSTELKLIKKSFFEARDIGTKKELARKYKAEEAELLGMLHKGGD